MLASSRPSVAFAAANKRALRPARFIAQQQSGRTEPFNENVAQVKRLINRDRKEFLGNSDDILDKYTTEFGEGIADAFTIEPPRAPAPPSPDANPFMSPSSSASPARPATPLSADNPFKSSAPSPFGSSPAAPKPFKQGIEPKGLTPDMSPDPIVKETPFDLLASIGLTQILIVLSFSLIIGLMVATFFVVLNAGGVRLAGLD